MTGLHESTVALSIYIGLARAGAMNQEQALALLRKIWHPEVEAQEIAEGVEYLVRRKFVTVADGILAPARVENGAAATVIRNPLEETELIYGKAIR